MKCEGEAICNNIAAPGHVYGLLATLGQLSAAFGIRWLGYIFRLGIIFIRFRVTFSANSILKHWVHDPNCIFKPFKICEFCNEVMLMESLGRFSWKQPNIRGVHSLSKNILMDRRRVQCIK